VDKYELKESLEKERNAWRKDAIALGDEVAKLETDIINIRKVVQEACDLLSEHTYGNPARSPGHNARLHLESVLSTKFKEREQ
jgi:hypothetical protein